MIGGNDGPYSGPSRRRESKKKGSAVKHPNHYAGDSGKFEVIKVIEDWGLNFSLGSVVKYIARAGKKDPKKHIEDLEKAREYLGFEIDRVKGLSK